jgi:peptide/nickel transport system substrate-binding protein
MHGNHHRPHQPRRLAAVLAPLLLAGVLAACGGNTAEESEVEGETLVERGIDETRGETGLDEAGDPVRGGALAYALNADTSTYCLTEALFSQAGLTVVRSMYETLMTFDADRQVVGNLAESMEPNDDATRWTITLRPGITFHDGSPLDATVVKNNIDAYRGAYPARSSQLLRFALTDIVATRVIDERQVEIEVARPWPALNTYLSTPRFSMMAQAQLDSPDCGTDLIGTGPFQFERRSPNDSFTVVRNPNYWRDAPDGKPYPYLDEIEFRFVPDEQVRYQSFLAGDTDMLHVGDVERIGGEYEDLVQDGKANMFTSQVGTEVDHLQLNHTQPPFDDVRMRRALAMAIDRDELDEVLADGGSTVATGPFPPGSLAYLDDPGYPDPDPEEARALIEEYEQEGGDASFAITAVGTPASQRQAELVQTRAEAVGFDVTITQRDEAALISDAAGRQYQVMAFRNFPGADPDANYVWWYGTSTDAEGNVGPNLPNFAGFDDPEVNRLLDEGRVELDPEKRKAIYEDLNRRMSTEVHGIWLAYAAWAVVMQPEVHGVLEPALPDGSELGRDLVVGHALHGIWKAD